MWFFFAALAAVTPAPDPSNDPAIAACFARLSEPSDHAAVEAKLQHYARASQLFALSAAVFDRCHTLHRREWNSGNELFGADSLRLAGEASHLAGDDRRAKRLVKVALARYEALDRKNVKPEPQYAFYSELATSSKTARADLNGEWEVFSQADALYLMERDDCHRRTARNIHGC